MLERRRTPDDIAEVLAFTAEPGTIGGTTSMRAALGHARRPGK